MFSKSSAASLVAVVIVACLVGVQGAAVNFSVHDPWSTIPRISPFSTHSPFSTLAPFTTTAANATATGTGNGTDPTPIKRAFSTHSPFSVNDPWSTIPRISPFSARAPFTTQSANATATPTTNGTVPTTAD
ncbi:hypothetical protein WOLCODRAFT_156216 [Wolfiporia cocos MD-104 SS10]|uniref:Glycoside hydrolase family 16 protein n=1 Tax=Wolfiporia cocos (strain MD-104) TaxID=742152 RepID=A0A2H3J9V4_WOLCO|nr:hypothetical protein WOLCODRAFT_156216 [Wolfiporia cocos MD-104 SS10]